MGNVPSFNKVHQTLLWRFVKIILVCRCFLILFMVHFHDAFMVEAINIYPLHLFYSLEVSNSFPIRLQFLDATTAEIHVIRHFNLCQQRVT